MEPEPQKRSSLRDAWTEASSSKFHRALKPSVLTIDLMAKCSFYTNMKLYTIFLFPTYSNGFDYAVVTTYTVCVPVVFHMYMTKYT
jgi:hypothetical protein